MPKKTFQEKMNAVENGLTPRIKMEGQVALVMNIMDRMQHYHVPNVSVAVFDEGEIFAETFNLSDRNVVLPNTLFQAGSISKPIAAVVALKLVEMGILSLDQNINDVLIRWKLPESEFTRTTPVTLRKLLSHTAGLNMHGFEGYGSDVAALPTLPQILSGASPANSEAVQSILVPSEQCKYSGGGTTIVQLLIEDAVKIYKEANPGRSFLAGNTFQELAKELVFDPLGMAHSTYNIIRPSTVSSGITAKGHAPDGSVVEGDWHLYPESAAAGLWTTPTDLMKFAVGVQTCRILSPALTEEALTRQLLSPSLTDKSPTPQRTSNFGLGFDVDPNGVQFGHSGVNAGFQNIFTGFTRTGQGFAIMVNSDYGLKLIEEMTPILAEVFEFPEGHQFKPDVRVAAEIDPAILQRYVGDFEITLERGALIRLTLSMEHGQLFVAAPYPGPKDALKKFELHPTSHTEFFSLSGQFNLGVAEDGSHVCVFGQKVQRIAEYRAQTAPISQAALIGSIGFNATRPVVVDSTNDSKVQPGFTPSQ